MRSHLADLLWLDGHIWPVDVPIWIFIWVQLELKSAADSLNDIVPAVLGAQNQIAFYWGLLLILFVLARWKLDALHVGCDLAVDANVVLISTLLIVWLRVFALLILLLLRSHFAGCVERLCLLVLLLLPNLVVRWRYHFIQSVKILCV